jgi:carbamoyltransferase
VVSEKTNPSFHRVLLEYEKLTGFPQVINTSFNMHEEPIVYTAADAVRAFQMGHLDALAIGDYIVTNPLTPGRVPDTGRSGSQSGSPA